jgi:hypothetical protein
MTAPTHGARHRLAKLLGMTTSSHDGEALVAARMAGKLIRELGLSWEQALAPVAKPSEPSREALGKARGEGYRQGYLEGMRDAARALRPSAAPWRGIAQDMLDHPRSLTEWETKFLLSFVHHKSAAPTPRQRTVFDRIANKLRMKLPEYARPARASSPEWKGNPL